MGDLNGKVAIVLGASTLGEMGEAVARRLKAEGATLAVSGLGAAPLATLAKELGGTACEADITRAAEIKALVDHTLRHHGRLDIAVNVAGESFVPGFLPGFRDALLRIGIVGALAVQDDSRMSLRIKRSKREFAERQTATVLNQL
jgi:NAD(P)-dependent dehydrogenase (short-subunit alcohol dehydrogenase family)